MVCLLVERVRFGCKREFRAKLPTAKVTRERYRNKQNLARTCVAGELLGAIMAKPQLRATPTACAHASVSNTRISHEKNTQAISSECGRHGVTRAHGCAIAEWAGRVGGRATA